MLEMLKHNYLCQIFRSMVLPLGATPQSHHFVTFISMLMERHVLIPTHQVYNIIIIINYVFNKTLTQLATNFIMGALLHKP